MSRGVYYNPRSKITNLLDFHLLKHFFGERQLRQLNGRCHGQLQTHRGLQLLDRTRTCFTLALGSQDKKSAVKPISGRVGRFFDSLFSQKTRRDLGSSTSRKPEKKTFGRFCVVFSCVAAGRVRQKAIIVFFSPTFATTPPLTQLLQETSIAQSSHKSSADASFLSRIGAKAKLLSGSRESKVRECRISSFSTISRKPRQEIPNR